jgi:hypothetical protein
MGTINGILVKVILKDKAKVNRYHNLDEARYPIQVNIRLRVDQLLVKLSRYRIWSRLNPLLWTMMTMRRNWIIGKGNGIGPSEVVSLVIIINER